MFTFSVYFFLSCGYLFPTDEVIGVVKRLPDSRVLGVNLTGSICCLEY